MEIDLEESVSRTITILKYVQVWPYSNSKIVKFFKVFVFTSMFLNTFTQYVFVYRNRDELEKISMALLLVIACTLANIKTVLFQLVFPKIKPTIEQLSNKAYQPKNERQTNILRQGLRLSNLVQVFALGIVISTLSVLYLGPVLSHWTILVFPAGLPYDPFEPVVYWITISWQSFAAFVTLISTISLDVLFWCLMLQIGAQCDVICVKILDLEKSGNLRQDSHHIVSHHQLIIKYAY